MLYVGLDVSMRATGLVVLNDAGNVVVQRVIGWPAKSRPCKTMEQRIRYFAEVGNEIRLCLVNLNEELAVAIEGYSMHGKGDISLAPELGGIVRLGVIQFERIHEVPPAVLKKFATGKGNATKDIVVKEVLRRWSFNTDDNNVADAYVLARMVRAHYLGGDVLTIPQAEALAVVFGGA